MRESGWCPLLLAAVVFPTQPQVPLPTSRLFPGERLRVVAARVLDADRALVIAADLDDILNFCTSL